MSKAIVGAKGCGNGSVKPQPNNPQADCPCDAFLCCSTRVPYGHLVWSNPRYADMAMSVILYVSTSPAIFMKYPYRGFYKQVHNMAKQMQNKPLILHQLTHSQITGHINRLALKNAGEFTNFQKGMVLRANLVRNGQVLRSDGFGILKEEKHDQLIPASGYYLMNEWNVDHVRTRVKGGCNRFCNAGLLSREANLLKGDKAGGCICAEVKEAGGPGQETFAVGGDTAYTLWQCSVLSNSGEKPVNKVPEYPPGMMKKYTKSVAICDKDDPRNWSVAMQKNAVNTLRAKISKISK